MKQISQTLWGFLKEGTLAVFSVHSAQKTPPQLRQWCFRTVILNCFTHEEQLVMSESSVHFRDWMFDCFTWSIWFSLHDGDEEQRFGGKRGDQLQTILDIRHKLRHVTLTTDDFSRATIRIEFRYQIEICTGGNQNRLFSFQGFPLQKSKKKSHLTWWIWFALHKHASLRKHGWCKDYKWNVRNMRAFIEKARRVIT